MTLRTIIAALILIALCGVAPVRAQRTLDDRTICNKTFAVSFERRLIEKPMGQIMVEIGERFTGAPYIAGSLDSSANEHLVVNLRAFDCVTFVENTLALARTVKMNRMTFDAYREELERIRYRDGKLNGYTSRLHYFLDWIKDNEARGIVRDVTKEIGGTLQHRDIDFMSTHRTLYPHLADDSSYAAIRQREKDLSQQAWYAIPKAAVAAASAGIETGDIIAVTTGIRGLDITHTGIAVKSDDGTVHLLHAPDIGKTVTLTAETLAKHLTAHPKETGIVVLRPVAPSESRKR